MLAYIRGTLVAREITGSVVDKIIVEVSGIAFEITVAHATALKFANIGSEITIHTSLTIRENDWTVYGFQSLDEKNMFALLQSVTGVGPKLALALVGTLGPDNIAQAISDDDQKFLSQAPGVGSKVAQRIILELKNKIEQWQANRGAEISDTSSNNALVSEARSILAGLGYTISEINEALKTIEPNQTDNDVEAIIRYCLKTLGTTAKLT
jgi:Holliday junction DNA helicase RuvA